MLLAVFPDTRQVLLSRHGAEDAEHRPIYAIPHADELRTAGIDVPERLWGFADRDGEPVSGAFVDASLLAHLLSKTGRRERTRAANGSAEDGLVLVGRREAADLMEIDDYWHMNRAFHLADWDQNTRFCGACASPMERDDTEIAKTCPSCGRKSYPQIAPAVIMAIVKDGQILMAHNRRHPEGLYSVLAGFVEAGETLEHTVSREVHEESGILVRNIRYFSSQPWPFPNSLMVAFTAEWAGGDPAPGEEEIEDVRWFRPAELPERIPSSYSVARRLIEWFVSEYGSAEDLQRILSR